MGAAARRRGASHADAADGADRPLLAGTVRAPPPASGWDRAGRVQRLHRIDAGVSAWWEAAVGAAGTGMRR